MRKNNKRTEQKDYCNRISHSPKFRRRWNRDDVTSQWITLFKQIKWRVMQCDTWYISHNTWYEKRSWTMAKAKKRKRIHRITWSWLISSHALISDLVQNCMSQRWSLRLAGICANCRCEANVSSGQCYLHLFLWNCAFLQHKARSFAGHENLIENKWEISFVLVHTGLFAVHSFNFLSISCNLVWLKHWDLITLCVHQDEADDYRLCHLVIRKEMWKFDSSSQCNSVMNCEAINSKWIDKAQKHGRLLIIIYNAKLTSSLDENGALKRKKQGRFSKMWSCYEYPRQGIPRFGDGTTSLKPSFLDWPFYSIFLILQKINNQKLVNQVIELECWRFRSYR